MRGTENPEILVRYQMTPQTWGLKAVRIQQPDCKSGLYGGVVRVHQRPQKEEWQRGLLHQSWKLKVVWSLSSNLSSSSNTQIAKGLKAPVSKTGREISRGFESYSACKRYYGRVVRSGSAKLVTLVRSQLVPHWKTNSPGWARTANALDRIKPVVDQGHCFPLLYRYGQIGKVAWFRIRNSLSSSLSSDTCSCGEIGQRHNRLKICRFSTCGFESRQEYKFFFKINLVDQKSIHIFVEQMKNMQHINQPAVITRKGNDERSFSEGVHIVVSWRNKI